MNRNEALEVLDNVICALETYLPPPASTSVSLWQRLKHAKAALSSPCACIDAQEVEDWIAGLYTMDDAVARAAEANALILKLRDRKPCACEGREPIGEEGATVYIRGSRAYAEIGSGMFSIDFPKGLKDGQQLEVFAFLPAKEGEA